MSKKLLQVDISKSKREDGFVQIRFKNEDVIQVNFSKLIDQSKYIRDKYKYSEALSSIQYEIEEIEEKTHINDESVKIFMQLIQDEKVDLPIEHYKDVYTLSEYFYVPTITAELDNISRKELFKDLKFTIQFLHDYEASNNNIETKFAAKIEEFLRERINECIKNNKFGELEVSTVFRIIDESKEKVDQNLLVDFIFESADTRFILLKLVEVDKLKDDKVYELIKFFDEQDETTKKMYLEFLPFNIELIKKMMNKYDMLFKEFNQTKQKFNQTKQELNQTKHNFNQTKQELNQTKQELNQTKQELNQTEQELNQTKHNFNQTKQELNQTEQELNQTKQELNQTKQELNQKKQKLNQTKQKLNQTKHNFDQTKQELNQTKQELNQTKQELNQTKQNFDLTKQELNQTNRELSECKKEMKQAKDTFNRKVKSEKKQYTKSIIVGGYDKFNQLGEKPNNIHKYGDPIISPPVKLSFDPSSLLSYSIYCRHSVLVMSDGSLKGIGDNEDGRISSTLQKTVIKDFTDFCIKDGNGRQLAAVSAVCCYSGTFYMFSKSSGNERQLVLCDQFINGGDPIFLDIGNHHPVSLFGGCDHSAAIGSEGEVIFINRNSVIKSPKSRLASVSLPDGEKASSVACCNDSVVVLSSNGRVFSSPIKSNSVLNFSIVSELSDQEIVCVSGTYDHFLAVSKEGRVFGRGSNEDGQLGLGEETESASSFIEIQSLVGYEIRSAYAGFWHSLFETREGKILSCGYNNKNELLLKSGPSGKKIYSPTETTIENGAAFCIAGELVSVVLIGNSPPPNTPNQQIQDCE